MTSRINNHSQETSTLRFMISKHIGLGWSHRPADISSHLEHDEVKEEREEEEKWFNEDEEKWVSEELDDGET